MTKAPLTPPPQAEEEEAGGGGGVQHRKPSVSFDLSNLPAPTTPSTMTLVEEALLSPTRSIDIAAHAVPDTICVSLLDRDTEMRHLVAHNAPLFNTLRSHLFTDWPRFENTLYVARQQLDDVEWMARISKALQPVPSLLQQFRDLVGYIPHDDTPPETAETAVDLLLLPHSPAPEHQRRADEEFDHVDITRIRQQPDKLKDFPTHYPQFFVNCQNSLRNHHSKDDGAYQRFTDTLFAAPSAALPDDVWEMKIYNQLDPYPDLVAQLKEIIAYETEQQQQH
ncbi:hypothetical protein BDB00DRAFT_485068 [Zychaea mexicana]|uniref:uncharacterized protein n=1 Tax=Zychaea mexicana TaxID=64656 RepID=UPI0022FED302|nr:uncharacterized protein BDB00DRAFT_485068 [Zychaea mexicana]KAI9491502.1 hypothetical protein BDB00DRAFT_485068 [Zychaea mexicana]